MRSVQELLAELAYVQRSCDYLLQHLGNVERLAGRITQLDPMQEAMIETETSKAASAIKGNLEIATRFAEDWTVRVEEVAHL